VTTLFLYDGWNLLAALNAQLSTLNSYTWGWDLSGTFEGAGGIGGLLFVTSHPPAVTRHFAGYDGNGNVTALVNAADQSVSARYEYGPFHELIRATGPLAKGNPFRSSTKFWDEETGLVYYGFRYYSPSLGRWISKDPIQEAGGPNLYAFIVNTPMNAIDADGRFSTIEVLTSAAIGGGMGVLGGWIFSEGSYTLRQFRNDLIEGAVGALAGGWLAKGIIAIPTKLYKYGFGPGSVGYRRWMAASGGFGAAVGYAAGKVAVGDLASLNPNSREGALGFGVGFALGALTGGAGAHLIESGLEHKLLDMTLDLAATVGVGFAMFANEAAEAIFTAWQKLLITPREDAVSDE
jgi:RHS repeat-associated protein